MIFSANISKALCLAAMGISLMMPAPVVHFCCWGWVWTNSL